MANEDSTGAVTSSQISLRLPTPRIERGRRYRSPLTVSRNACGSLLDKLSMAKRTTEDGQGPKCKSLLILAPTPSGGGHALTTAFPHARLWEEQTQSFGSSR